MILSELIEAAHIAYKGNLRVPANGSDKYKIYLSIANRKQREWANDPYIDWASLYLDDSIGTVSSSNRVYDLPSEIIRNAEYIYLKKGGSSTPIKLISPREGKTGSQAAYISGKTLTFTNDISEILSGSSLVVPAYYIPDDLTSPNSEVAVDNPDWLVYALASELARNDYSKDDQFSNLAGMANDLYDKMRAANDDVGYLQSGTVPFVTSTMGL